MLARHSLVWLSDAGWEHAQTSRALPEQIVMRNWRDAALPAVARRAEGDATPHEAVWLGLALPPDPCTGGKPRIAFHVAARHVLQVGAPLKLGDALGAAPPTWQKGLRALQAAATGESLQVHTFGSLAWQAVTGMTYLTPQSDIDLLWYPRNSRELDAAIELLVRFADELPLDGEIVFPDGQGVAWKEWLRAGSASQASHRPHGSHEPHEPHEPHTSRVLAKAPQAVRLVAMTELRESLGETACRR